MKNCLSKKFLFGNFTLNVKMIIDEKIKKIKIKGIAYNIFIFI